MTPCHWTWFWDCASSSFHLNPALVIFTSLCQMFRGLFLDVLCWLPESMAYPSPLPESMAYPAPLPESMAYPAPLPPSNLMFDWLLVCSYP